MEEFGLMDNLSEMEGEQELEMEVCMLIKSLNYKGGGKNGGKGFVFNEERIETNTKIGVINEVSYGGGIRLVYETKRKRILGGFDREVGG